MKNVIVVTLALFLTLLTYSNANADVYSVSYINQFDPSTKSCYRWMTASEAKKWMKGKPFKAYIPYTDYLKRAGENGRAIFCWTHPAGSVAGGELFNAFPEIYGNYLVRIDFVDDAVTYNRVLNRYFRWGDQFEAKSSLKRGINTEIVYGNYMINGSAWFQEIIIRDISVIKSYTFDDSEMRDFVETDFQKYTQSELGYENMHFYINYCEFGSSKICSKYKSILKNAHDSVASSWKNNQLPKGAIKTGNSRQSTPAPIK